MKYLIVIAFVIIAVFLIRRSRQTINPAEQDCAREIGELIKSNPDAEPQVIAEVFAKHGINQSRCQTVGAMVMPQLRKQGLKAEDARIAMIRVRAAYPRVME